MQYALFYFIFLGLHSSILTEKTFSKAVLHNYSYMKIIVYQAEPVL